MKKIFLRSRRNASGRDTAPAELDLSFYRCWYNDLASLSDSRLIMHWRKEGPEEGRHPNLNALLLKEHLDPTDLPEDFSPETYVALNPDIKTSLPSNYHAIHHYLKTGAAHGRPFRFDWQFYVDVHPDLAHLKSRHDAIQHWLHQGRRDDRFPSLNDFLASLGVTRRVLPSQLTLDEIHRLNPDEHYPNLFTALKEIATQIPVRKLSISEDPATNANFYLQLALHQERIESFSRANELYQLSLHFASTALAHEHLGNLAVNRNELHQAITHYRHALKLGSRSEWVPQNLAHALFKVHQFDQAVDVLIAATATQSNLDLLSDKLDDVLYNYWHTQEQALNSLAISHERSALIETSEAATKFVADAYARFFTAYSTERKLSTPICNSRVLIIGTFDLPQCLRYRIEQKVEQLELAGYQATAVNYRDHDRCDELVNFHDIVIFYRVPASIRTIRTIERTRALGKVTFYDIDDLLIDPVSPPPIESFGGQVSLQVYANLTKDTAVFRAAATLCDFAISSTKPLLDKLSELVRYRTGFLHRNALDDIILKSTKAPASSSGYINIFYGSGTLAHNSDFIDIALPAINKLLQNYPNTRLVTIGHLKLPALFLKKHGDQVVQFHSVLEPKSYLNFLSSVDINLAVLHDDIINDCKSEIKWMEAAHFGIPSVMSRTKNYVDTIDHGVTGFLATSHEEWYEYLEKLTVDASLRQQIGAAAQTRIRSVYMPEALSKNIVEFLDSAIRQHSGN